MRDLFKLLLLFIFFEINHKTSSNLYWSYYPHRSRELVSPVCGIFLACRVFSYQGKYGFYIIGPVKGVKCAADPFLYMASWQTALQPTDFISKGFNQGNPARTWSLANSVFKHRGSTVRIVFLYLDTLYVDSDWRSVKHLKATYVMCYFGYCSIGHHMLVKYDI